MARTRVLGIVTNTFMVEASKSFMFCCCMLANYSKMYIFGRDSYTEFLTLMVISVLYTQIEPKTVR